MKNGAAALAKAKEVEKSSQRERDFIAALEVFYKGAEIVPHPERAKAFEKAMRELAEAKAEVDNTARRRFQDPSAHCGFGELPGEYLAKLYRDPRPVGLGCHRAGRGATG